MNILRKYKISKLTNTPLNGVEEDIVSFTKKILDDLILFKHDDFHDSIFYMNSKGDWIFEQNTNSDYFWVRYSLVWEVLETKYLMEDIDIQIFIKYIIEEAFKFKIGTPFSAYLVNKHMIEEVFKNINYDKGRS